MADAAPAPPPEKRTGVAGLVERVLRRERAAVATALNLVEDRRPAALEEARSLLAALGEAARGREGHVVGLTGAPGVGKSTLAGGLARALRTAGRTVAVLAIDPSSVRSGGALLGDRVRIEPDAADAGLFVRSLASRGRLGGLAPAAAEAAAVLQTAYDVAIVETVGVGQSEAEVATLADTVVLVLQPGAGDALQFLKAGIMEVPDLLVLNKMDMPEAARTAAELRRATGREVIEVSARARRGLDALATALLARHESGVADGTLAARRRNRQAARIAASLERRFGEEAIARAGGRTAIATQAAERLAAGEGAIEIEETLAAALR